MKLAVLMLVSGLGITAQSGQIDATRQIKNLMSNRLGDFAVMRSSPNVLTVGAGCSITTPCTFAFGATVYSYTAGGTTFTLTGGTDVTYIYLAYTSGAIMLGYSSGLTATCLNGTCFVVSGVTQFPPDCIPLAVWTAVNGIWDVTGTDWRATLRKDHINIGPGMMSMSGAGFEQLSVDSTVVPFRLSVPSTPASPCGSGMGSGVAFDENFVYVCVAPNTWRRAALSVW